MLFVGFHYWRIIMTELPRATTRHRANRGCTETFLADFLGAVSKLPIPAEPRASLARQPFGHAAAFDETRLRSWLAARWARAASPSAGRAFLTNGCERFWQVSHMIADLSEKFEEAIPLHKALKELYESLTKALENDPPPEVRINLWHSAREALLQWIEKEDFALKVQKFIGKIRNGFDYWFTFVVKSGRGADQQQGRESVETAGRSEKDPGLRCVMIKELGTERTG